MKKTWIYLIFFLLICYLSGYSQQGIPAGYFASPLKINLEATGAFAEIRANHFHSGIDFKTLKKEGIPILAVADGFVSRIKVSPVGFGNALYIDHPCGYTSVYGHMLKYNNLIGNYVYNKQYEMQSFAADLFPARDRDTFWIKKGDTIGFSGNSGTSYGAHLHFEMRTTITERILNPYLFGYDNTDQYYPYFDLFKVYPMDNSSSVGASDEPVQYGVRNPEQGLYYLDGVDTLFLWGNFAFGVQAFDYMYNHKDRNGFYGLRMLVDNVLCFSMQCDSFSFDESRNINACIDYPAYYKSGYRIVKSNRLPGNALSFFKTPVNNGVVPFTDGKAHSLVFEVYDIMGRVSRLTVPVVSRQPGKMVSVTDIVDADTICRINYDIANRVMYHNLDVTIPASALYENLDLTIKELPTANGLYSARYAVHNPETPLQKNYTVSIKADKVPASLADKALIVYINSGSGRRSSEGGKMERGWISAETNRFGVFSIAVDNQKPSVKLVHQKPSKAKSVKVIVKDDLSGIAGYRGEINGQWALVEWDPKYRLMIYRYDQLLKTGKNVFKLTVWDKAGNTAVFTTPVNKK